MVVAYLSLDEVNHDIAARAADESGATVDALTSLAEVPDAPYDAVIYDLDYVADHDRQQILNELTRGPSHRLAAVHSYNLGPSQKRALRRNGVLVQRRLHPGWLRRLIGKRSPKVKRPRFISQLTTCAVC
jgi:hypothetical protein